MLVRKFPKIPLEKLPFIKLLMKSATVFYGFIGNPPQLLKILISFPS